MSTAMRARQRARTAAGILAGFLLASAGAHLSAPPVAASWARTLTVSFFADGVYGDGRGRVTSDDGAIDCSWNPGPPYGDCSEPYVLPNFVTTYDTTLTLTPEPGSYVCLSGSSLCDTSGGARTFPVHFDVGTQGDITVNPSFNLRTYAVHVDVIGHGAVTGNGAFCPVGGNVDYCGLFKHGSTANLIAAGNDGSDFDFWNGPHCGVNATSPTCTFTVTGAVDLAAIFSKVTVEVSHIGSGDVCFAIVLPYACGVTSVQVNEGASVMLEARPASGWHFAAWTTGPCVGQGADCTFVVLQDAVVTARFEQNATPPPPTATPKPTPKPTPVPTQRPASTAPPATPAPSHAATGGSQPSPAWTSATTEPGPSGEPAPSGIAGASPLAGVESTNPTPGNAPSTPGATREAAPATSPGASSGIDPMVLVLLAGIAALVLAIGYLAGRRRRHGGTN